MVLQARMASLEETIARAIVIDPGDAVQGVAAIGSTVWVEDLASGTTASYLLTSAHQPIGPDVISVASPIGRALMGAVPGTVATVDLPNGRTRSVRLVDVDTGARRLGSPGSGRLARWSPSAKSRTRALTGRACGCSGHRASLATDGAHP